MRLLAITVYETQIVWCMSVSEIVNRRKKTYILIVPPQPSASQAESHETGLQVVDPQE